MAAVEVIAPSVSATQSQISTIRPGVNDWWISSVIPYKETMRIEKIAHFKFCGRQRKTN